MSSRIVSLLFMETHPVLLFTLVLLLICLAAVIHLVWNPGNRHLYNLPGPLPLPFVGNALMLAVPPEEVIPTFKKIVGQYGSLIRFHLGHRANAVLTTPEAFEKVLSSNAHITKGLDYRPLLSWLGTGLLA